LLIHVGGRQDGAIQRRLQPGARGFLSHEIYRHAAREEHDDDDKQRENRQRATLVRDAPKPAAAAGNGTDCHINSSFLTVRIAGPQANWFMKQAPKGPKMRQN
jgi:hypothetical protein